MLHYLLYQVNYEEAKELNKRKTKLKLYKANGWRKLNLKIHKESCELWYPAQLDSSMLPNKVRAHDDPHAE